MYLRVGTLAYNSSGSPLLYQRICQLAKTSGETPAFRTPEVMHATRTTAEVS